MRSESGSRAAAGAGPATARADRARPIGHDTFTIVNAAVFDGRRLLDADTLEVRDGILASISRGRPRGGRPGARVIDAGGGLVTPGFVDAHAHPVFAGAEALQVDLTGAGSAAESLEKIRSAMAADRRAGRDGWLRGGGWSMADFPGGAPRARLLDEIESGLGVDRPVQLASADHHSTWVNTAALRIAGIDADTPDPPGGVIDRDEDGEPTGTLHEAAVDLVGAHVPLETPEELRAALLEAQRRLHEVGVTGYIDAIVGEYLGHGDNYNAYLDAQADGVLSCEVTGSLWWGRGIDDVEAEAERMAGMRVDGPRFRATNVKFMLDGIVESLTAAMTEPYHCPCEELVGGGGAAATAGAGRGRGSGYFTAGHLAAAFAAVAARGFDIHCHAIGDAAVRQALDAFATLPADPGRRHHIAHLQVVDPVDVPRLAALGVTANLQALWAHRDQQLVDLNLPVLGPERTGWLYPFGSIARSGARLAMGSDWPVSSPDPWQAIHVAVNRTHPDAARPEPLGAGQALDLATCLRAYTSGSARLARTRTAGRMVLGAPADLALTSANPFTTPADRLCTIGTTLTVAAGRTVHDREDHS